MPTDAVSDPRRAGRNRDAGQNRHEFDAGGRSDAGAADRAPDSPRQVPAAAQCCLGLRSTPNHSVSAIQAGLSEDVEPFAELRDTRKLDEPQQREANEAAEIRDRKTND